MARDSAIPPYLLLVPPLLGAVLVLYATSVYGLGVDGDSVYYYNAGESLIEQRGLVTTFAAGPPEPLTHFPPLYPALLAPFHLFPSGIEYSARFLNAALFAIYLMGVQWLVLQATGSSRSAALLAGFFTALSTVALSIYVRVWSETLFLVLFVLGTLLIGRYLRQDRKGTGLAALTGAGALFALAWLDRYVGVTLVAAGGLAILLWGRGQLWQRLRDSILFGAIASMPMAVFLVRNVIVSSSATNRELGFHPVSRAFWREGVDTLSAWLLPIGVPVWIKALGAFAVLALVVIALAVTGTEWRREPRPPAANGADARRLWTLPAFLLLFCAVYLVFFYTVVTFADSGHLSGRTLSPVYTSLIVLTAFSGHVIVRRMERRPMLATCVVLTLCVGLLAIQLTRSAVWAYRGRAEGFEFSSRAWRSAPSVEMINELPPDTEIHTNWPPLVYFLTGRHSVPLAFAGCLTSCDALVADLDAIRTEAAPPFIVWADYVVGEECYPCLLADAAANGFDSVHEDERFHIFAPLEP